MDIRHLRTFAVVAEHGTVSKASTLLGVAQPALSRQIKDLETELDVKLFDRIRRRLVLTNEGQLLLGDCRSVLGAVHSLKDRALLLRRPDAGVLKVAATPQTIDGVLSVFLARYAERRPNVQIKLTEAFGTELVTKLDRGDVHIIVTTAGAIEANRSSFETISLPPLEFVAAFGPALDFEKADSIDVGRLGSHPLLLLNTSFAVRVAFDAACRLADFWPNVTFESRTPHTLLALAEAGHGIAGRLACMTRAESVRGGAFAWRNAQPSGQRGQTNVLVIGELGWPLLDDGRRSNKLSRASTFGTPVVSERRFSSGRESGPGQFA